jgi:hypothetical protein
MARREPLKRLKRRNGMRGNGVTALVALAALTLSLTSSAEAKFKISLVVEPAHPVAGQPVRMIIRTGIVLPREHEMRLHVVGPWRERFGQAFFDVRLVRTGPRAFRTNFRFRYAGRWSLFVPSPSASPPIGQLVSVRPRK